MYQVVYLRTYTSLWGAKGCAIPHNNVVRVIQLCPNMVPASLLRKRGPHLKRNIAPKQPWARSPAAWMNIRSPIKIHPPRPLPAALPGYHVSTTRVRRPQINEPVYASSAQSGTAIHCILNRKTPSRNELVHAAAPSCKLLSPGDGCD